MVLIFISAYRDIIIVAISPELTGRKLLSKKSGLVIMSGVVTDSPHLDTEESPSAMAAPVTMSPAAV